MTANQLRGTDGAEAGGGDIGGAFFGFSVPT
jgi:hypothetical protein